MAEQYELHPNVIAKQAAYTSAQKTRSDTEAAFHAEARNRLSVKPGGHLFTDRLHRLVEKARATLAVYPENLDARALLDLVAEHEHAIAAETVARLALEAALSSAVNEFKAKRRAMSGMV
jgi:hypothetical protein